MARLRMVDARAQEAEGQRAAAGLPRSYYLRESSHESEATGIERDRGERDLHGNNDLRYAGG